MDTTAQPTSLVSRIDSPHPIASPSHARRIAPDWVLVRVAVASTTDDLLPAIIRCVQQHHVRNVALELTDEGPISNLLVDRLLAIQNWLSNRVGQLRVIDRRSDRCEASPTLALSLPLYPDLHAAFDRVRLPR